MNTEIVCATSNIKKKMLYSSIVKYVYHVHLSKSNKTSTSSILKAQKARVQLDNTNVIKARHLEFHKVFGSGAQYRRLPETGLLNHDPDRLQLLGWKRKPPAPKMPRDLDLRSKAKAKAYYPLVLTLRATTTPERSQTSTRVRWHTRRIWYSYQDIGSVPDRRQTKAGIPITYEIGRESPLRFPNPCWMVPNQ